MPTNIPANEVREWATDYWPHVSGADWDGQTLKLLYGTHWHTCSQVMVDSLAKYITKRTVA